jgi:tripartite-type tricarboxylate transporter receptor subunit TctC
MIGIKLTAVPFTGGAPAVTALLGGHVTCYMGSTVTLGSHIKPEGRLRVLVSLTAKRLPDFPDVPTCGEKGYDVGDLGTFQLVAAKKGTPKPILDILVDGFRKTATDPSVKTSLTKAGFLALEWGPEETEKKVTREFNILRDVHKKLGLEVK